MTATDPRAPNGTTPPGVFAGTVVLGNVPGGVAFVPASTPLTRLNYYDGKFLRAADLTLEQRAQRALVLYANRAGGPGVVHGFNVARLPGARIQLSDGLAIDPSGRVLFLPDTVEASVADLLDAAEQAAAPAGSGASAPGSPGFAPCETVTAGPTVPVTGGAQLYLVAIAHAEGLCGNEEVFGRLCDDACVTATDRPYVLEGIVLQLLPLSLHRPLATSSAVMLSGIHLRSRVASAYFADEWAAGGSLLSAPGLRANVWCLGAPALLGAIVPVGVLAWIGGAIAFLDQWTARRERMQAPSQRYWAGRMELRPWPVFLAQVLQFQCQLAGILLAPPQEDGGDDPYGAAKGLLDQSTRVIDELLGQLADPEAGAELRQRIETLKARVAEALVASPPSGVAKILIDGGIVELPPAGYLPVDVTSALALREQVRRLMGAGVDLRFCAVRRDQIAHELERAQHMDRISLLTGLDDPSQLEEVDILVPDGEVGPAQPDTGLRFAVDLAFGLRGEDGEDGEEGPLLLGPAPSPEAFRLAATRDPGRLPLRGAGRIDLTGGQVRGYLAALGVATQGARALLGALGRQAEDGGALVDRVRRLRFGQEPADVDADAVAREMAAGAIAFRAGRGAGRVISFDEAVTAELLAVWATLWVAADPFTLPMGGSCAFSASLVAFVPGTPSSLVDRRADGRLEVRSTVAPGGALAVPVQLTGHVRGDNVNVRGAADPGRGFTIDALLSRERVGDRNRIALSAAPGGLSWAATAAWAGAPIAARGGFSVTLLGGVAQPPPLTLAELEATQDPATSQEGNEHHDAAMSALTILQGARPADPSFVETAVAQLFPGSHVTPSAEIRPTLDWVLFRRRRREDCGDAKPPPPPAPSPVATWVSRARTEDDALESARLLRNGSDVEVPWTRVDTVEFDAGTSTLRTPAALLRQDYESAGGGSRLVFAGYGANGAGPPVGHGRAQAIVSALVPAAVLDPGGAVDLVADPPAGQMVAGTDASVFLVSYELDCVEVVGMRIGTEESRALQRAVVQGDVATVLDLGEHTVPLGVVTFTGATPTPGEVEGVSSALASAGLGVRETYGWIAADWAAAGHEAEATAQLRELVDRLQVALEILTTVDFPHPGRCPARLYLLIQPGVIG